LEPSVEGDTKVEVMFCLFKATWLATMVCKNVAKDTGNDKLKVEFSNLEAEIVRDLPPEAFGPLCV
jgi:hypothetical protein